MLAAFVGGMIRGFVGFGGALVIILVANVTLGPTSALPIAARHGCSHVFGLATALSLWCALAVCRGVGTGLVQGAAGVGGPPAVTVALARGGSPERQRANVIGAVTALALCAMVPMWWHGLFTLEVVVVSVCAVPVYSFATWFGARLFQAGHQQYFRRAAVLTLASTGVTTLLIAIRDLMV